MEFLVLLVIGVAVFFASIRADGEQRAATVRAWKGAARELGLSFAVNLENDVECSMQGVLRGVPVRADFVREVERTARTTKVVDKVVLHAGGDGKIPVSLVVRADSFMRTLGRFVAGQDEEIGDQSFDELVELPSLDAYACAALSASVRAQLSSWIERGGEVRQGILTYNRLAEPSQDQAWLVQVLRFLAQLAGQLAVSPQTLYQRLAENALRDRSPGVRLRNLRFLCDPTLHTPPAVLAPTCRALLSDSNPVTRLLAAQQLGDGGAQALSELASNRSLPEALRVEALQTLDDANAPELLPLLPPLLAWCPERLACAALTIIMNRRWATVSPAVLTCTRSEHETVRAAAATALARVTVEGAEQVLVQLLSDESAEVQRASAEALGAVGSVAAVEPLLSLADRIGRPSLRQAARGAIGRIQSRLGDVEAGRVSLADDHALTGALSLAEPSALRAGEVSLVPDPGEHPGEDEPMRQELALEPKRS